MAERSNWWEIILYPESLPEYWRDVIEDTKVPAILSPKHNMDVYTKYDEKKAKKLLEDETDLREIERLLKIKEGVKKKDHYHLLVNYGNGANKSISQVQEDFINPLNAKKYPNPVKTDRGAVRYLVHMDHPDKFQYRLDEVTIFNGFNCKDYFDISNGDIDNLNTDLCNFIDNHSIANYYELERITREWLPWHKYVVSHSIFFTHYFASRSECRSEAGQELLEKHYDDLSEQVLRFVLCK